MFFQSSKKKKRLWRARVKQPATTLIQLAAVASTQQQTLVPVPVITPTGTISNNLIMNSSSQQNQTQHYSTYQQMDLIQQQQLQQQQQINIDESSSICPMLIRQQSSTMTIDNLMNYSGDRSDSSSMIDGQENSINGYYYENSIESTTDYEEDQTMSTTASPISTPIPMSISTTTQTQTTTTTASSKIVNLMRRSTSKRRSTTPSGTKIGTTVGYTPMIRQKSSTKDPLALHQLLKTRTTSPMNTNTSTTVCDWMRNCCGGGGNNSCSTDSINYNQWYQNNNNNNNVTKLSTYTPIVPKNHKSNQQNQNMKIQQQKIIVSPDEELKPYFLELYVKIKEPQLTTLMQAVDSLQKNTLTDCTGNYSNNIYGATQQTKTSSSSSDSMGHQPDCVLVPRTLIMGLEPSVVACRIWRWADIKSSKEIKSIASCRNEKDRIYACCNPTHWYRIYVPETPPPPYQLHTTERLKSEDHASNEITKEDENHTNDSIVDQKRDLSIQFPGSLTTENEDTSILSSSWCELAYWEFKQRVGGRFPVENSSVNIFFDQYRGDGMCLKTLAEQRQTVTPEQVLKVRQKIGLGVTLSQEADGVWLYNRSSSPVFVHSPTLNSFECWSHVTKVPPDYCLKAYDTYKAKTQDVKWPSQIAGAQTGPIDTHSMRISFAKGWGAKYTRQDVTACPCWLEVLLRR